MICAFAVDERKQEALRLAGVKDSKKVLASTRRKLHTHLLKQGEAAVVEISAEEITEKMKCKISLNEVEAEKIGEALKSLDGCKIRQVFIDSPDPNPEKFKARVRKYFDGSVEIVAANKADEKWTVVGAASIVAKEVREKRIEEIKKEVGVDFGSGYSSDERTISFLKKHINKNKALQKHLRHKWDTAKRLKYTHVPLGEFM